MPFPLVHCRFNSYFQTSISDSSNCWLQRIRRDQHLSIDCNQFCSKAFKRNQFLCILYPLNWTHPTSHHFCWIIHCTITFNQYKFIQKNLKINHNYFPFLIFFHFFFFSFNFFLSKWVRFIFKSFIGFSHGAHTIYESIFLFSGHEIRKHPKKHYL